MAKGDPVRGGRVVRTDTGEEATYVDDFRKGGHEVLRDTGPKQVTMWLKDVPVQAVGPRKKTCDRCGGSHHAFDCPEWQIACPEKLDKEQL